MAEEKNLNSEPAEEKAPEEGCTAEQCAGCASAGSCPSQKSPEDMIEPANSMSVIKHVVGIISGKGGVGKSYVTGAIAVELAKRGHKVGIMDADITGPSIQKMFGITGELGGNDYGIYPLETKEGIKVMSINMLLDKEDTPVIWRGPVLAGVVKQFWTDVIWGDLDYLLVDMPPGTGDVPLTVFQSLPIDGTIIVTSPQSLVTMIVKKAYNMTTMLHIPVLGIVENFSYLECPDCGKHINVFGESTIDSVAEEIDVPVLGKIPLAPQSAALSDAGRFSDMDSSVISGAADAICKLRRRAGMPD